MAISRAVIESCSVFSSGQPISASCCLFSPVLSHFTYKSIAHHILVLGHTRNQFAWGTAYELLDYNFVYFAFMNQCIRYIFIPRICIYTLTELHKSLWASAPKLVFIYTTDTCLWKFINVCHRYSSVCFHLNIFTPG